MLPVSSITSLKTNGWFTHAIFAAENVLVFKFIIMEQRALKNVSACLNTNIVSYLETFGGQSSNLYLNVVHF